MDNQRAKLSEAEDQILGLRGAHEKLAARDAELQSVAAELKDAERALEREPNEVELHHKVNILTEGKQRLEQRVDQLKARVKKLEAERREARTESANKAMSTERTIRELRYRVELDRRAYVIQQLELESAISRAKGAEQRFELKTQEALKAAKTEALELVDAELRVLDLMVVDLAVEADDDRADVLVVRQRVARLELDLLARVRAAADPRHANQVELLPLSVPQILELF